MHTAAESSPEATPVEVGRFQIVREHARGGMGRVCEAVDTELNRRVAFKDIQERFADDPATRGRFVREAVITGQLEHPGVIPVYGLGTDASGRPFYAMRFVEGQSLKDAAGEFHAAPLKRSPTGEKAVAFRGLLKRFADVCNAVAFAHSKRIVHRDLKPANVMLGPFGETLVVDWGLARSFADRSDDQPGANGPPTGAEDTAVRAEDTAVRSDSDGTRTGQVMGTPAYMSPEQAAGQLRTLGPAWDVYSLGATLYHLLTGRPPFTGKPMGELIRDVLAGTFPPPRAVAAWVPRPLDAVVRKAMAREAGDRYPSALELAAEIDRYLADEPVAAYRESAGERARRWARRHRGWVQAGVSALLVTFVVLAASLLVVNGAREQAVESDRLKTGALKREEKSNENLRQALESAEAAKRQSRAALDTATDEVVGRLLGRQAEIGPPERAFLKKLVDAYESLGRGADAGTAGEADLRVAQIYEKLGDQDAAARHYRAAADHLRPLTSTKGSEGDRRSELSVAALGYARTALRADTPAALASMREGLLLREALSTERPNDPRRAGDLAAALLDGGDLLYAAGDLTKAQSTYEAITTNFTAAAVRGAFRPETVGVIARAYDQLALIHERKSPPEIAKAYQRMDDSYALFRMMAARWQDEPSYQAQKGIALSSRSLIKFKDGKADEAAKDLDEAIGELAPLVERNPAVRSFRAGLGQAHLHAAIVAGKRNKPDEAARHFAAVHREFTHLHRVYPSDPDYLLALTEATRRLAEHYETVGDVEQARKYNAELRLLKKGDTR